MGMVRQTVVLVGGRGSRLGSLTAALPKPMLDVAGRPFLEYQIEFLRRFRVDEVLFCAGYLAEPLRAHFGNGERFGLQIQYSIENQPAGTGGALKLANAKFQETFFVLNGDTIFDADLFRLGNALAKEPDAAGAIALRELDDVSRFGQVLLDKNRVTEFVEKPGAGSGLINGGIYCLRREIISLLPKGISSIERDLFPLLARQRRLIGIPFTGYFLDIGLPETLARAQAELPAWFAEFQDRPFTRNF